MATRSGPGGGWRVDGRNETFTRHFFADMGFAQSPERGSLIFISRPTIRRTITTSPRVMLPESHPARGVPTRFLQSESKQGTAPRLNVFAQRTTSPVAGFAPNALKPKKKKKTKKKKKNRPRATAIAGRPGPGRRPPPFIGIDFLFRRQTSHPAVSSG